MTLGKARCSLCLDATFSSHLHTLTLEARSRLRHVLRANSLNKRTSGRKVLLRNIFKSVRRELLSMLSFVLSLAIVSIIVKPCFAKRQRWVDGGPYLSTVVACLSSVSTSNQNMPSGLSTSLSTRANQDPLAERLGRPFSANETMRRT